MARRRSCVAHADYDVLSRKVLLKPGNWSASHPASAARRQDGLKGEKCQQETEVQFV